METVVTGTSSENRGPVVSFLPSELIPSGRNLCLGPLFILPGAQLASAERRREQENEWFMSRLPAAHELRGGGGRGAEMLLLPAPPLLEPLLMLHVATSCCSFRCPRSCHFLLEALPDRPAKTTLVSTALSFLYSPINALIPEKRNDLFNVLLL